MNVAQPVPRRPVPVPAPFGDEPTRQVDDDLLTVLRNQTPAKAAPKPAPKPAPRPKLPRPNLPIPAQPDEPTRMAHIDSFGLDDSPGQDDRTSRYDPRGPQQGGRWG